MGVVPESSEAEPGHEVVVRAPLVDSTDDLNNRLQGDGPSFPYNLKPPVDHVGVVPSLSEAEPHPRTEVS